MYNTKKLFTTINFLFVLWLLKYSKAFSDQKGHSENSKRGSENQFKLDQTLFYHKDD